MKRREATDNIQEEHRKKIGKNPSVFSAKTFSWLAIAIVLLAIGIIRYRLVGIPLERDEGEYAYGGQIVLEGKLPTQYVYSMKLPGIYYAYAVLLKVFGQTAEGIHTGLLCMNLLTILAVFMLAGRLMSPLGAITAAVSFALLSVSRSVTGATANAEHFVILFAIFGVLILLKAVSSGRAFTFFISGLLLGAGGMMKQHGVVFCVFAVLYLAYEMLRRKNRGVSVLFRQMIWLISGMLVVPVLLIAPIIYKGQFDTFWFWTVTCSRIYVSDAHLKEILPVFLSNTLPMLRTAPLFVVMAGLGVFILILSDIDRSVRVFLGMYAAISFLAVCPGFYFRYHYFILLLPAMGLLVGLAVCRIMQFLSGKVSRRVQWSVLFILIVTGIAQPISREYQILFRMTPSQVSRRIYGLNPFPESLEIADFITKHTTPSDTIAVLGSEPQIFFYAKRHSATPYIYMYPMMQPAPLALQMQTAFVQDIETQKPRYVIFVDVPTSWDHQSGSYNLIFKWFGDYQDKNLKLVGTIKLADKSIYHWGSDMQWPQAKPGWIALFERLPQ